VAGAKIARLVATGEVDDVLHDKLVDGMVGVRVWLQGEVCDLLDEPS
jgi:hypothetical protein